MGDRWARFAAMMTGETYVRAAEPAPAPATTRAGAVGTSNVAGRSTLAPYTFPAVGVTKATALAVPTLQRAHDITVALVAACPIVPYRSRFEPGTGWVEELTVEPLPWHTRPDPAKTRQAFLGALASDCWAFGRAYCRVSSRYTGPGSFPASFQWLPFEWVDVQYPSWSPPEYGLVPGCRVLFGGAEVPYRDVVEVLPPTTGACELAWRAIRTAGALEEAAERFAGAEVPAGWLRQTGGEPLSAEELDAAADKWHTARRARATGALSEDFEYVETQADPSRLQLVEGRQHQALELARIGNVPPYLVGAPSSSGMTYQNAQQARLDAVSFGAAPILDAIAQALSAPTVSPVGQGVYLDTSEWLAVPLDTPDPAATPDPAEVPVP